MIGFPDSILNATKLDERYQEVCAIYLYTTVMCSSFWNYNTCTFYDDVSHLLPYFCTA